MIRNKKMQLGKTEPMSLMRKTELSESKGIIKRVRASEMTEQAKACTTKADGLSSFQRLTGLEENRPPKLVSSSPQKCFHCTHVNTMNKM